MFFYDRNQNNVYILGMGVRNRLLKYSSLQINLVGGQANSSLHIHTQTSFLKQMYTFSVWHHWHVPCTKQMKCIKFLCGACRAVCAQRQNSKRAKRSEVLKYFTEIGDH